MSTSCIDPRGSTFSLENPRRWALTDSSFSILMPMSAELPLSTKTLCTVLLAID